MKLEARIELGKGLGAWDLRLQAGHCRPSKGVPSERLRLVEVINFA